MRKAQQLGSDLVLTGISQPDGAASNIFHDTRANRSVRNISYHFSFKALHHIKGAAFTLGKNSLIIGGGPPGLQGLDGGEKTRR